MQTQEIFHEIRQLIEQYRAEVPGGRRAWPEAVKSRVRAISAAGASLRDIAERTGLPYYTIIAWVPESARRRYRKRSQGVPTGGKFSEIAVVPAKRANATVTVANEEKAPRPGRAPQSTTVTVTLPGGIEVKGVTSEFLAAWLGKAGGQ
jgi:hypothetical protein